MLTHFDDCAGIGGFALAAEWAGGIITIAARELDPYARRVYALRFSHVRLYGDARGPVPDESPDLYTCGFPCQPVSVAGKRLGEKDPRWLWPDIARTIRLLRPRWVLLENVPGLLVRGMGAVLGDLAACGYDAEWDCIPAAAVGAPHRRDRLWIVAYPTSRRSGSPEYGEQQALRPAIFGAGGNGDVAYSECSERRTDNMARRIFGPEFLPQGEEGAVWPGASGADVADAERGRLALGLSAKTIRPDVERGSFPVGGFASYWRQNPSESTTESFVGRVAHGVPNRVDRLRCLGNAIVPQVACWILRRIVEVDAAFR